MKVGIDLFAAREGREMTPKRVAKYGNFVNWMQLGAPLFGRIPPNLRNAVAPSIPTRGPAARMRAGAPSRVAGGVVGWWRVPQRHPGEPAPKSSYPRCQRHDTDSRVAN